MYDAFDMLHRIDNHPLPIMVGFGLAMAFQTIWMVDCLRVARVEKRLLDAVVLHLFLARTRRRMRGALR